MKGILTTRPGPILGILAVIAFSALMGSAQSQCPADKVCISPEAMKYYLGQDDKAKALEAENKVLKDSVHQLETGVVVDLKVALGKATGELTGCQQSNIDLRATNQVLITGYKARNKYGLINF